MEEEVKLEDLVIEEEKQKKTGESSKKKQVKKLIETSFQISKAREKIEPKNFRGLKLEDAAKIFLDFIRPSVNKAHVVK
jgi:hypothetical protein